MKSRHAAFWLILAVMAFGAMAASSPQCARSTDDVTGPSLGTLAGPNECENGCKATRRGEIREERRRHRLASKACNGDEACHAEEDALHQMILAEIEQNYQDCLTACAHQQGSGLGGQ
jgi:hypothetical protein